MSDLVLSNATSFFSGNLEKLFKNAHKYGFKYVEIAPYRWSKPRQIIDLQKQYGVIVAGIHLPMTSWQNTFREELKKKKGLWIKFTTMLLRFYMGNSTENPGIKIAEDLADTKPYFLIHSDIAEQIGGNLAELEKKFHVVIENIPENPNLIKGGVFDHNHFIQSRKLFPSLDIFEAYKQAGPEVIHISYDKGLLPAFLPNDKEQTELKQLLKIYQPKYITIETNPLVSIKKGKLLLEKILNQ